MSEIESLPQGITAQIRYILEGIRSGKLEHNQSEFHCGTAHCVAGWHSILNAEDWGVTYNPEYSRFEEEDFDEWYKAKEDWQLTNDEADILFFWNANLETQFGLLEYLEAGNRVTKEKEEDSAPLFYYYTEGSLGLVDENEYPTNVDSPFLRFLREKQKALVKI